MSTSYFQQQRRLPTNEDRVFKQRRYEAARNNKLEEIREHQKLMSRAIFDESCDVRLSQRYAELQAMQSRTLYMQSLALRRSTLKNLLQAEEDQLYREIATAQMNLAQRRAWLQAHISSSNGPLPLHQTESSFKKLHNTKLAVSYFTQSGGASPLDEDTSTSS
ncbi:hypothetical protein L7F22_029713 [Adiantum nelumboides]|nr:hypothetical protein [Adiantum nelumboides]MCO5575906.1 hypothetical protein [Adiantum nelumboides]